MKPRKFRAPFLRVLAELLRHPHIHIRSAEVAAPVHPSTVRQAAKRAGRTLDKDVASLAAELPKFCVEWFADIDEVHVEGSIGLCIEFDSARTLDAFGHTRDSAPEGLREGALLDYQRADNVDGVIMLTTNGVITSELGAVYSKNYGPLGMRLHAYLDSLLRTRGADCDDETLARLFG